MPVCFHIFFPSFHFQIKNRRGRGKKSENERMLKFFIYDLKEGGIMQSVIFILLFIKESYYDVILCQKK